MDESISPTSRLRRGCLRVSVAWAVVLLFGPLSAGQNGPNARTIAENPHGDSMSCTACHTSPDGDRENLRYGGNTLQLCQSCHDGRHATREAHPVNLVPSAVMAKRIPPDFPLERGVLTCLSCHDVIRGCRREQSAGASHHNLLRGLPESNPAAFCLHCHTPEDYRPFNAHDQVAAGKPKTEVCGWCHTGVPPTDAPLGESFSSDLRAKSDAVCRNCHTVAQTHPVVAHMQAVPSAEMMWYMSAREMQSRMSMPLPQLLAYARATKRIPRSIPLDEAGRITCYSCHNPHEKALLPEANPRSAGADAKQATNHRLRIREGQVCVACHQK
jgi:hypothetical protein